MTIFQKTISTKVSCSSVAVHSGAHTSIALCPANCDTGIVFKRIDVKDKNNMVVANYKNVVDAKLGTTIANKEGVNVATIEHLMAAIWGCGIDNLIIEIDGPEIPIMDGSSEPFVFLIECAGVVNQEKMREYIEITKPIRIEDGDKFIEAKPANDFSIDLEIDFAHSAIPRQKFFYNSNQNSFKNDLCRARTFGFKKEIDYLRSIGLARGGSLDNAVLVDDNGIVNQSGLRYHNEFVLHKTIDFIGDIFLAGNRINAHFSGFKTGHAINNKILHQIFSNKENWRIIHG